MKASSGTKWTEKLLMTRKLNLGFHHSTRGAHHFLQQQEMLDRSNDRLLEMKVGLGFSRNKAVSVKPSYTLIRRG